MMGLDRDVGQLEARMQTVEQELHAIRSDVREIRDALVSARAGWWLFSAGLGFATASGALLSAIVPQLILR